MILDYVVPIMRVMFFLTISLGQCSLHADQAAGTLKDVPLHIMHNGKYLSGDRAVNKVLMSDTKTTWKWFSARLICNLTSGISLSIRKDYSQLKVGNFVLNNSEGLAGVYACKMEITPSPTQDTLWIIKATASYENSPVIRYFLVLPDGTIGSTEDPAFATPFTIEKATS